MDEPHERSGKACEAERSKTPQIEPKPSAFSWSEKYRGKITLRNIFENGG
jgi:hypothetical protein